MKPSAPPPSQQARILWQTTFDKAIVGLPVPLADGVVVALNPLGDPSAGAGTLKRVDLESGGIVWTRTMPAAAIGRPIRTSHRIGVPLADDSVAIWNLDDGQPVGTPWAATRVGLAPGLAASRGRFFVRSGVGIDAVVSAYEPGCDDPLWVRPDPLAGAPVAIVRFTSGVLVMGGERVDDQAFVTGLRVSDGETCWVFQRGSSRLNDIWAVGGQVDVVTSSGVVGIDAASGASRPERFTSFPLDAAVAAGEHVVAVMEGHNGPVLLCFATVSQRLTGRVDRQVGRLIGAHPDEVLVSLKHSGPAFFSLPELTPVGFPEGDALGEARGVSWARDVCYVVSADGRTLTAIDLSVG